jgi:UDP-N-acetylglucosamine 2-epimerase (non-hydrolysing)
MAQDSKPIYVVLGTRAQFIKMAPLLLTMQQQGVKYRLIYSAQHRESIDQILEAYGLPMPDVVLYDQAEANTRFSFTRWLLAIVHIALFRPRSIVPVPGLLLTHGDTFTAWLGAWIGKRAGCVVCHVESGCRSYNMLSPFPEELSRLLTFRFSNVYFCADEWSMHNLSGYDGLKVNIGANTMLDGVRWALEQPYRLQADLPRAPYGIVSLHRFENIYTSRLTNVILPLLREIGAEHRLIFVLHPTTRERLQALGLYESLGSFPNLTLHERFGFVDWIHICRGAAFVITDGGSNQEELSYLGVPTLLFRRETERREGLGRNVVVSSFDKEVIRGFFGDLARFKKEAALAQEQPSLRIIETLKVLQQTPWSELP